MLQFESVIRIEVGGRLKLIPAVFRFTPDEEGNLHLEDAILRLFDQSLPWNSKAGLAFSLLDRRAVDDAKAISIRVANIEETFQAKTVRRPDGMTSIAVQMTAGEVDLAETPFADLISLAQREALETLAPGIAEPPAHHR